MRVGRLLIVLAILVILALVALYAVLNSNAGGSADQPVNTVDIVMVMQPIARGEAITAEQLGLLSYPSDQTIEGMFTDISQVTGRRSRYDLTPGTPLNASMLADDTEVVEQGGSDTALLIPSGMVAFPIPIDRFSSLAYGLRAGDHVNVIATLLLVDLDQSFQTQTPNNTAGILEPGNALMTGGQTSEGQSTASVEANELINVLTAQVVNGGPSAQLGTGFVDEQTGQPFYAVPSESQRPRLVSQTLLQDIVVLHVGNHLYTDSAGNEVKPATASTEIDPNTGQTIEVPVTPDPPDIITLIVTPQDAVTLNYLIYVGAELNLALRPSGDDSLVTTEAVTLEFLLNTYNIPVPSKLPYGLTPRIDTLISPTQQDQLQTLPQQP
ncbi:MAG: Flp pilus assembly protein CpaB [Anaerolineales bacterium]|jgi:pilus assembly protein CpaB|nr:Flp pilus assembly protein CpaB [Anaerolineales bacterium]MCW5838398.1 Flp pilus assembly protein CpaB [Anaerolineales bacterium]MCW5887709.1 Flp pilus assembly protein CpaB [Anaerolineales bacterium]